MLRVVDLGISGSADLDARELVRVEADKRSEFPPESESSLLRGVSTANRITDIKTANQASAEEGDCGCRG
jgi:hypothetical protein